MKYEFIGDAGVHKHAIVIRMMPFANRISNRHVDFWLELNDCMTKYLDVNYTDAYRQGVMSMIGCAEIKRLYGEFFERPGMACEVTSRNCDDQYYRDFVLRFLTKDAAMLFKLTHGDD